MKNKQPARKRTFLKPAKAAPAAAPKTLIRVGAEVHVHPSLVEIRFNGETGPSERMPYGVAGSDAHAKANARIQALEDDGAQVTIRHFNAQGVETE